jgi:EAL domain-containing protein (putative c-di-GMP-specific phosphodiesterase class I)
LAAIGVTVETLTAFRLVPLVAVAWSDDRLEENEHDAILKAAEKSGIDPLSPAMAMLKTWTTQRPTSDLFDAWCHYSKSLSASLNGATRAVFQQEVVEQVKSVARSAGGVIGFGSISASEKAIIDRIEQALA